MSKREWAWLFLIFLLVFAIRLPWSPSVQLNFDEGSYFWVAQTIHHGGIPYVTAWDHKGMALYLFYLLDILLFDKNLLAFRLYSSFIVFLQMGLVYAIARKFMSWYAALAAPFVYGMFFSVRKYEGVSSNSELFMMLPTIAALFFFSSTSFMGNKDAERTDDQKLLLLSGLFSGVAVMLKPTTLFTLVVVPLTIFFVSFRSKKLNEAARKFVFYLIGALSIVLLHLLYFYYKGALRGFYEAFIVFNREYQKSIPLKLSLLYHAKFLLHNLIQFDVFVWGTLLSLIFLWMVSEPEKQRGRILLTVLTILSLAGVLSLRNAYNHYYLQMALPTSLLAARSLSFLSFRLKGNVLLYAGAALVVAISIVKFREFQERVRMVPDETSVVRFVQQNTSPSDTIYIYCGKTTLYFLCDRHPGSKYFSWVDYNDRWLNIMKDRAGMFEEFNRNKPKYFIVGDDLYYRSEALEGIIQRDYSQQAQIGKYFLYRRLK